MYDYQGPTRPIPAPPSTVTPRHITGRERDHWVCSGDHKNDHNHPHINVTRLLELAAGKP